MHASLHTTVNDVHLSYSDPGGNGLPLIFIHGFPFNRSMWDPQIQDLKRHARVITYDLRGFGESGSDDQSLSMDVLADDLVWFMDRLNIPQAVVCGLSMGGYILLNAVERYPQRFSGIILSDTQCLADSKENKEKRFTTIKDIQDKGLDAFADNFLKGTFAPHTQQARPELVKQVKQMILGNKAESITAALKAMAERKETCSGLKHITAPTLVLCGKEDTLTPPSLSEYLFNNIPGAQLHEIEQAGHLSNLEQPETFNRHVADFIKHLHKKQTP